MKEVPRHKRLGAGLLTVMVVAAALVAAGSPAAVWAEEGGASTPEAVSSAAVASLHNPTFDNHIWYEFHLRYDHTYPSGSWLPDDDTAGGPQDWRLWYMGGWDIIQTWAESTHAQSVEAVGVRTYGNGAQLGGLYQVVSNTTPCLLYNFRMYGQGRPDPSNATLTLQVGIDRVGWHPNSAVDPAVHGSFPTTTLWGTPHTNYNFSYGLLEVTAEAWANQIVVYTYGDAPPGVVGHSHKILWDTGSLQDVTPAMIHDPNSLPAPGGISNLTVVTGTTSATITWTTANAALDQVYYRRVAVAASPSPYTYTTYLPVVQRGGNLTWLYTPLNKTPTTSHTATISGLESGATYEFIAVSRGLSGGQCATWVSAPTRFVTLP